MALLCLLCTLLAVLLAVPPSRHRAAHRRLAEPVRRSVPRSPRQVAALVLVPLLAGVALVVVGLLGGAPAAVVGVAVLLAVAGVVRLLVQQRRFRAAARAQREVAEACSLLASHLLAGQVAGRALALSAADCPVLREAHQIQGIGGDVTEVWLRQGHRAGHQGLLELARAWRVSTATGAPLSATLELVADSLAADQTLRAVVAGELAAPRATSKIMAVLPGLGIGIGYALGGEPLVWLLAGPLGWVCLVTGVALACAGVLWIEGLARRAMVGSLG